MAKNTIRDDVLISLRRITRAIDLHSKSLVREYGVTGPQIMVMHILAEHGECSIGEVAKKANLSPATITEIVRRLENRQIVGRKQSEMDKRRSMVHLTDLGGRIFKNAPSLLQERFVEQFETLQDWEQTSLLSSLQRIASMMEAKDIEASPILVSGPIEGPLDEANQQR